MTEQEINRISVRSLQAIEAEEFDTLRASMPLSRAGCSPQVRTSRRRGITDSAIDFLERN